MEFFEDLRDKTIDLAQAGVAKSKQLMEIARLNMANATEETAIRRAYLELGKIYYAERGMAPEAAYTALCEKITQSKINIEENKARIAEVKQQGDIKDADISPMETEIPPEEEDCGCSCGCSCEEQIPEAGETCGEADKPEE